jgi:ferredoxin-NADP reductase
MSVLTTATGPATTGGLVTSGPESGAPATGTDWLTVTVTAGRVEADQVISLTLEAKGALPALPAWEPGAHLDVRLPSGLVRQYSLCGDPADPAYTIAVLREQDGRGGSAEIHDTALLGRTLEIRGPKNHFRFEPAASYVFIAGGIGVTPILPMARAAARAGTPWQLHYGGRRDDSMAFRPALEELAGAGGNLVIRTDDREGPLPLAEIVRDAPEGSLVYACGPAGMLAALRSAVTARPDLDLRIEQFTAGDPGDPGAADPALAESGASFEVELAKSGETVTVEPGTSILEAVRELRPDVLYSCEEGFCGSCETKVLAGDPVHRDTILSDKERARNTSMMICVGGCTSKRLVLDL